MSRFERLADIQKSMLFTQYTTAITSGVLAVFTFSLAAIGLYGILSYSTNIRRFEIATRMAIGAKSSDIIKLIFIDNPHHPSSFLSLLIGYSTARRHTLGLELRMS